MDPVLLNVKAACGMISCSRPTLYKLMKEGRIRAVKNGRRTLIPAQSLKDFADSLPGADDLVAAPQQLNQGTR